MSAAQFQQILPGLSRWRSGLEGAQHPVNSYLWKRGKDVVLIDPASDLTPVALGEQQVTDILITHLQEENAAGCMNFTGVRIHVPAGDEDLCQGAAAYETLVTPWPPPWTWETRGNYRGHVAGARNERPLRQAVRLAEPLQPGPLMLSCEIVATPGHGKNAVTILARIGGERVAFCGDLIYGDGQLWNWFDAEWDYGLESGQRALRQSALRLKESGATLLCPTHGPVVRAPRAALDRLCARLGPILDPVDEPFDAVPFTVADEPSPAPGFRRLLPALHQYARTPGNCNVLVSASGHALMVDDGLCEWIPISERDKHHRKVIAEMKASLGIRRIEIVIPTHYHGDHLENIRDLVAMEGCEVVCLDAVAEVIEHPERFNLACPLPWYGTNHATVKIDRWIRSGTRLRWREFELEIFHLGGQTYYHAGIDVRIGGKRVLFVGDAMGAPTPACEPVLCYNDGDPVTRGWLYAVERMIEREPEVLVCGHAVAVRQPMALLLRKRSAWKKRIEQFRALCPRADLRQWFDPFS
ncbi:MAG: MBL fold metallo-hydrolase [Verrucomicrobiae bacterium]|nr:MBL fold metallo-hydrolase [Verrucomicrobiae bacterium]